MVAKEWHDARWKLLIGVLAFLVFVSVAPRPYERIVAETERQIEYIKKDIRTPGRPGVPEGMEVPTPRNYEEQQRKELERMQEPGFRVEAARWEIMDIHHGGNFLVLIPLAGLLGVALVSGEVGRGSVFLLLSRPLTRTRALLTKYSVCAVSLLVVATIGVIGTFVSAYAHDYPWGSLRVAEILVSSALFWLGSLFVLGLALLLSVALGDTIRSVVAAVVALYLLVTGPGLLNSLAQWLFWTEQDYARGFQNSQEWEAWNRPFEYLNLLNYWTATDPFTGEWVATRNLIVCLVTAALPLLAALWLFRRKAY